MLELSGVDSFYGNSRALQNVNFRVDDGEFMCVLGRNGVGKTTLMRTILGLMDRVTGSIRLGDKELVGKRTHQRAKAGIGYVPQGRGILPKFTVHENLRMGTFARGQANGELDERVFKLFPILKEHINRRGGNLSGGQQQQLAIARALLTDPKVILLDEPTEGIQPNIVEEIENVLVQLNEKDGMTIVLVEQSVAFARRASHRFAMMDRGTIAVDGSIDQLSDDLVHRYMTV